MRKSILTLTITGFITLVSLTSFAQESKKVEEAKKDVKEAKKI